MIIITEEYGKIELNKDTIYFFRGDVEYPIVDNKFVDFNGKLFTIIKENNSFYLEEMTWRRVK